MKKVLFALSICIAAAAVASCNKDEITEATTSPSQDFIYEAVFETPQDANNSGEYKVEFDQDGTTHTLTPKWEVGDKLIGQVKHHGSDVEGVIYTVYSLDLVEGKTYARLTLLTQPTKEIETGDIVSLIYAPGIENFEDLDITTGELPVDLSTMVEGNPKGLNAIMYASVTIPKHEDHPVIYFEFKNKTAILEIDEISGMSGYSSTEVSKVVVSGNGVFNKVAINLNTGELTGLTKGEITYTPDEPIAIQDGKITGKKFFAVILPGERQIDVCAAGNGNYFKSSINKRTYVASKCYYTKRASNPVSFTVNASGKRVIFAPGNLVYTHPGNWDFAETQLESIGKAGGNLKNDGSFAVGDKVDLFSWSTESNKLGLKIHKMYSNLGEKFYDWGQDLTYYSKDYWYTLTWDEWEYLITHHEYLKMDDGTYCYIVFAPDNVALPITIADCVTKGCLVLTHSGLRSVGERGESGAVDVTCTNESVYHTASYGGTVGSGSSIHYCDFQVSWVATNPDLKHQGSVADGVAVRLAHELK